MTTQVASGDDNDPAFRVQREIARIIDTPSYRAALTASQQVLAAVDRTAQAAQMAALNHADVRPQMAALSQANAYAELWRPMQRVVTEHMRALATLPLSDVGILSNVVSRHPLHITGSSSARRSVLELADALAAESFTDPRLSAANLKAARAVIESVPEERPKGLPEVEVTPEFEQTVAELVAEATQITEIAEMTDGPEAMVGKNLRRRADNIGAVAAGLFTTLLFVGRMLLPEAFDSVLMVWHCLELVLKVRERSAALYLEKHGESED